MRIVQICVYIRLECVITRYVEVSLRGEWRTQGEIVINHSTGLKLNAIVQL